MRPCILNRMSISKYRVNIYESAYSNLAHGLILRDELGPSRIAKFETRDNLQTPFRIQFLDFILYRHSSMNCRFSREKFLR